MTRCLALAVAPCIAFWLLDTPRSQAQSPAFEVASIKLNPGSSLPMVIGPSLRNGTFRAANVTLKQVLAAAYGLTPPRIIGPEWLEKDRFDFMAKSPQSIPDSQLKPMLQTLLHDRFKLAAHSEMREMPVYDLVVANGGVRMSVYPAPAPALPSYPGNPMMRGDNAPASRIAEMLSRLAGRPVLDKTGLNGHYNYALIFAPLAPSTADRTPDLTAPDLFTAVQEQLGLKLQANREKIEVVLIDRMERMPTEN